MTLFTYCLYAGRNLERKNMAAVSALTLVMLGALIHGCCGLKCYECNSKPKGKCDDQLDIDDDSVKKRTCPSTSNACMKAYGSSRGIRTRSIA